MVSSVKDISQDFVSGAASFANVEVFGWDYFDVQIVNPSGTLTFNTTNDGGDVTGSVDPGARRAKNWGLVLGTNLATAATSTTATAAGTYQFRNFARYFQLTGTSITADKVIITLYKTN